jgi:hypothetical protein
MLGRGVALAQSHVEAAYQEIGICRNKKFFDPFPTIGWGEAANGHKALWSRHSEILIAAGPRHMGFVKKSFIFTFPFR